MAACAFAAPVIYQAENGTLSGTTVSTALAGYQGTGYVDGFDAAGDYCQVTVNVATAGMYNITIGYAATMGQKINDLYANGVFQASVTFASSSGFTSVSAGMVPLNAGNNTLRIQHNWGWFYLDWFGVEAASLPALAVTPSLVNPAATDAAKCLMKYLCGNYGNYTVSGQTGDADVTWINTATARYPALKGFDMMDYSPSRVAYGVPDPLEVEKAIAWYQAGGIVQFQWHWNAPNKLSNTAGCEWWRGFYSTCSTFDISYAMNNTTSQDYLDIIRDIDAIAVQLKRLRDAGVPVLWRPLHEAQGGWFWWGAHGYQPCMQLYHLLYDRLTSYHGLNNLIWVWTTQDNADSPNWYPGGSEVDIIGADIYLPGGNYSPSTSMFYNIVNMVSGNKLVALTETGTIPDPALMTAQHAHWAYFMTWGGFENDPAQNSLSHVQSVYSDAYVLTREELSGVYSCVLPSATFTVSPALSPTFTRTITPSVTLTATLTGTLTYTMTQTLTQTRSSTLTPTMTLTATPTSQPPTSTLTATPTSTLTATPASTLTATPTFTSTAVSPLLYGTILFATDRDGNWEIYRRDLSTGAEVNITNNPADDLNPMVSPDGTKAVFASDRSGNYDIWEIDLAGLTVTNLTSAPSSDYDPAYSPDGSQITFKSNRDDGYGDIFVMNSDGTSPVNLTAAMGTTEEWDPAFTGDGSEIVFVSRMGAGPDNDEIFIMNKDGSGLLRLTNNAVPDWYPSCPASPGVIYFVSRELPAANEDIYSMGEDGSARTRLTYAAGDDNDPMVSADNGRIVYNNNSTGNYELFVMNSDGSGAAAAGQNAANELCPVFVEALPAVTPTHTPFFTATVTVSLTQTFTQTRTLTLTATPTPQPPTLTLTETTTLTATPTSNPPTSTLTATATSQPFTSTLTSTQTSTITATPTSNPPTSTLTATMTSNPPTSTLTATTTLTATVTSQPPTPTLTATSTLTVTQTPGITAAGIYPNPVKSGSGFTVAFDISSGSNDNSIVLYTAGFRLVRRFDLGTSVTGFNSFHVPGSITEGMAAGIYVYVVTAGTGQEKKRDRTGVLFLIK